MPFYFSKQMNIMIYKHQKTKISISIFFCFIILENKFTIKTKPKKTFFILNGKNFNMKLKINLHSFVEFIFVYNNHEKMSTNKLIFNVKQSKYHKLRYNIYFKLTEIENFFSNLRNSFFKK